jgi:MFS family permease
MLGVLKIQSFRRYYVGFTTSSFGDSLTPFALAFAVLRLTGSPADLGLVMLSTRLPVIVFALVGGAVGDRFSRRLVMLSTDAVRFLTQGVTAAILLAGVAQIWMLIVLQLIAGAGAAFFNPAAQGLVPSLVGKDDLHRANSLLATSRSAISIAAVGTAGALVALAGPGWAIGIDSITFLVSAVALYLLPRFLTAERLESKAGLLAGIRKGIREVRDRTWLWVWTIQGALINMLVVAPIFVLGPYVAKRYLDGAPSWAAIGIGYTVGGVIGGLISSRWRPRRPMVGAVAAFLLIVPLGALLAWHAPIWLLVPASLMGGVQVSIYNVLLITTMQKELSNELMARATSVVMLGAMVATPIGMGLAGPIAASFGTYAVLGTATGIAVVATIGTLAVPAVWRIRGVAPASAEESSESAVTGDLASTEG